MSNMYIFLENGITIESLQYMTSKHLQTICSSHDYDTISCFEKKLKKWQASLTILLLLNKLYKS